MKILLIEDNQKTSDWVSQGLTEAGYVVDRVSDGRDGLRLALEAPWALIILDIMLPGLDGWQVLKAIRSAHQTPVICLTARDAVEDRVKGLESGANDYLVKPFSFAELLARVRTQLRNHPSSARTSLKISGLEMDSVKQSAFREGKPIILTRKEFLLLWLLASRAGEIIPRTVIASEVWGINFDSETNTVDVAIRRLRAKVDDPFAHKLINTVRGMGYRFSSDENNET
ncbi:TPA: response regulator transcription factor HprR [Citrobacter freundii]